MTKFIHAFSDHLSEGINQTLLGNKGFNLCAMHRLSLPVPEGFIITSKATKHLKGLDNFDEKFLNELQKNIDLLQKKNQSSDWKPRKTSYFVSSFRFNDIYARYA